MRDMLQGAAPGCQILIGAEAIEQDHQAVLNPGRIP
jgi:hypothetical protein